MGIAHTIRIRDRIIHRLSLLLSHENYANKYVFRTYIYHSKCVLHLQNQYLLYRYFFWERTDS